MPRERMRFLGQEKKQMGMIGASFSLDRYQLLAKRLGLFRPRRRTHPKEKPRNRRKQAMKSRFPARVTTPASGVRKEKPMKRWFSFVLSVLCLLTVRFSLAEALASTMFPMGEGFLCPTISVSGANQGTRLTLYSAQCTPVWSFHHGGSKQLENHGLSGRNGCRRPSAMPHAKPHPRRGLCGRVSSPERLRDGGGRL